ncbi:MAG: hypothetical protein AAF498_08995 [Pseudomonadota bacterium]
MISKRLIIWLRDDDNQERLRLWLGAVGAVLISVLTLPTTAEADEVRIIKADGALLDAETPDGITIVNRRSKIIFVDPAEFAAGHTDTASPRGYGPNLIRLGEAPESEIAVYRGGQLSSTRSTGVEG